MRNMSDTMAKSWRLFSTIIICNTRSIQCTKLNKKGFYAYWRPSIREIMLRTFFQPFLLSQQLDTMKMSLNMQNQQNLMIFSRDIGQRPRFGPILGLILGQNIFFQKSTNVTFLDLFQANLMQKIRKKWYGG